MAFALVVSLVGPTPVDARPTASGGTSLQTASAEGAGVQAIAVGLQHTCAITSDGTVSCWGSNGSGETAAPVGTYTAITAGNYEPHSDSNAHTCAITTAGTITCWGANYYGQTNAPAGTYTAIAAGWDHTCAIATAGTITCWGANNDGQLNAPAGTYTAIAANVSRTCAISTAGTIICWGDNGFGQTNPPAGTYTAVSVGYIHTCAIATAGTVACWGYDVEGETDAPAGTYTAIAAGGYYTCAIATAGTITCWGANYYGQTNAPAGTYTAITAGVQHACAITNAGTVTCWGDNSYFKLGGISAITSAGPASLVNPDEPYSHAYAVSSVVGVTWSVTSGALPPGVVLDSTSGVLSGAPTTSGTYSFTVSATNLFGSASQAATITVNAPPSISSIANRTIAQDTTTGPVSFTVGDDDGPSLALVTSASSNNQTLLPDANVVLTGTGSTRSITVTPAAGQTGTATVTVTVTDPGGLTASTSFTVSVTPEAGSISGVVTRDGVTAVGDVIVVAFAETDGFTPTAYDISAADGTYTVGGLPVGDYRLAFVPMSGTGLQLSWYATGDVHGVATRAAATVLAVPSATTAITGVDVDLIAAASIAGTVIGADGLPAAGIQVRAWASGDTWVASGVTTTGVDGTYEFTSLAAGTYKVQAVPPTGSVFAPRWHLDAPDRASATALSVDRGQAVTDIDIALPGNSAVIGTVTTAGVPLAGASVAVYREGGFLPAATATTAADGTYTVVGLPANTYRVRFTATDHVLQWWDNAATRGAGTDIVVANGSFTAGIDAALVSS